MVRRRCPRDNRQLIEFDIPHQELPVLKKPFWVGLCGFLFYESKTLHHVDIIYINIPCLVKFHVPQLFFWFSPRTRVGIRISLSVSWMYWSVSSKKQKHLHPWHLIDWLISSSGHNKNNILCQRSQALVKNPKKTSHSCLSWINGTSLDFNTPYTRFVKTLKSIAAALWKFWQTITCSKGSNYPL